jgi:ATP-binding cassette, subfamily B, multidrug efflux pump
LEGVSGKAIDFRLLRRVFKYIHPYRGTFIKAVILTISLSALSISRPLLIMYTIKHAIVQPDAPKLLGLSCLMVLLLCLEAFVQFFNMYLTSRLGQNIVKDIRKQLYRHIYGFRSRYFDHTPIGTLVTRIISDIEAVADIFSQGFIVIAGDILTLSVFLATMLLVNWKFTLVVCTTIPVLLLATWLFKNAVKSAFQDVRTAVARLNAFVQEHITGMKIVQIFNREGVEFEKFKEINEQHRAANIRSIWHYSVFFPVVEILASISIGLLVWKAGDSALSGIIPEKEIAAQVTFFLLLVNMMFRPIRMLADRVNTLQMGMVSCERIFKVLDTHEIIEDHGTLVTEHFKGDIEFQEVWFAYNAEDWVLRDVSFRVQPGETIAIVGATGAGKSSIINLLNRFYEYNKGSIRIDGDDIRQYTLSTIRKNIGIVQQDVFLFSDTIANNISLNHPGISREHIINAAKMVGAHEFIMQLPGNYDYDVKERGAMLSVGQRQLISFIRAYCYNPSILVLDEATSSIDSESEQLIQYATQKLTEGRTSIIIAHRLATIQRANRILVMEKGRVIESGSHAELIRLNGQYKKLFELQFKEYVGV